MMKKFLLTAIAALAMLVGGGKAANAATFTFTDGGNTATYNVNVTNLGPGSTNHGRYDVQLQYAGGTGTVNIAALRLFFKTASGQIAVVSNYVGVAGVATTASLGTTGVPNGSGNPGTNGLKWVAPNSSSYLNGGSNTLWEARTDVNLMVTQLNATYQTSSFNGTRDAGTVAVTPYVPEPSALALAVPALFPLGLALRRRRG